MHLCQEHRAELPSLALRDVRGYLLGQRCPESYSASELLASRLRITLWVLGQAQSPNPQRIRVQCPKSQIPYIKGRETALRNQVAKMAAGSPDIFQSAHLRLPPR